MKWMLAATLVAMTGCATDDPIEPGDDSDAIDPVVHTMDGTAKHVAIHLLECMPVMSVSGAAPYSVQCAVAYSVSEASAQIEFIATDANGQTWVSGRAAAPMPTVPDAHGTTVFALESMTVPTGDNLIVKTKVVDAALSLASDEISAAILVRR